MQKAKKKISTVKADKCNLVEAACGTLKINTCKSKKEMKEKKVCMCII